MLADVVSKQQMGPVKLQGLVDLYEKGSRSGIADDTLLWAEHMSGWMKIKVCCCASQPSLPFHAPLHLPPQLPSEVSATMFALQDLPELHELLQTELKSRRAVEPRRPEPSSNTEPSTAGRAVETPQDDALELSAPAGKVSGSSAVIAFLKGWLPKRAPPEDLIKRGILREAPAWAMGVDVAKGTRRASIPVSKAAPSDGVYGSSLRTILHRPDTKDGIPALVRILMGKLLMDGADGLKHEGIFRSEHPAHRHVCMLRALRMLPRTTR